MMPIRVYPLASGKMTRRRGVGSLVKGVARVEAPLAAAGEADLPAAAHRAKIAAELPVYGRHMLPQLWQPLALHSINTLRDITYLASPSHLLL